MGKPFRSELEKLQDTILWAEKQDVTVLRSFFSVNAGTPLICIGSGGSYSAASYAAMLYKQTCGLAVSMEKNFDEMNKKSTTFLLWIKGDAYYE